MGNTGYFDEAGHPCDPQKHYFGFGGFLGTIEGWNRFAERWIETCPPEFYPFHMTDFVHATRDDRAYQAEVLTRLIDVISESMIVPISTICHVCEFKNGKTQLTDAEGGELYTLVLNHMFAQVSVSILGDSEDEPMPKRTSIVFAQRKFAGRASDMWWDKKQSGEGPLASTLSGILLASVSTALPETVPPLQAADLLAYEVGHHYDRCIKAAKQLPFRRSYQRLRDLPAVAGVGVPSMSYVNPWELYGDALMI